MSHRLTTLRNGLRLVTVPRAGTNTVTVFVLVKVGSRYETASGNGVSHFIEHLMFKGTTRRPTTEDISQELDAVGADYNAFTSKDWTGYYIKVSARHAALAVDVLADMIWHSADSDPDIALEKGVIVEEIHMYQDNPLMYVEDLAENLTFQGHPLGRDIAGSVTTVRGLTRRQLRQFKERHYQPQNMVLVVAGKTSAVNRAFIAGAFGRRAAVKQAVKPPAKFVRRQRSPRRQIVYRQTDQVEAAISWPGVSRDHRDALELQAVHQARHVGVGAPPPRAP
ncbi:MAG: pitrilysin family protein, partial [Patescibacteria group bacterium]